MALMNLFDAVVTVQRKTRVADGQGGFPEEFTDVAELTCRFSTLSGRDMSIVQKKEGVVLHAVYFAPAQDVRIGDRLTANGRTFEVRTPNVAGPTHAYMKSIVEEYQRG